MSSKILIFLVYVFLFGLAAKAKVPSDHRIEIQFLDSVEFGVPGIKAWKKDEITELRGYFDSIQKKQPGLMKLAAINGKINLKRISQAEFKNSRGKDLYVLCFATSSGLIVCDQFFSDINRFSTMVHELTHMADFAGEMALSSEIGEVKRLEKSGVTESCDEFFADYISKLVCGAPVSKTKDVDSLLQKHFWNPSSEDVLLNSNYRRGIEAYEIKKYSTANAFFQVCQRLNPKCLRAKIALLRCNLRTHAAPQICEQLESQIDNLFRFRKNSCEMEFLDYALISAEISLNQGNYEEAKHKLLPFFSSHLNSEKCFLARALYFEIKEDYKSAVDQLRKTIGFWQLASISKEAEDYINAAETQYQVKNWHQCLVFCDKAIAADNKALDAFVLKCKCQQSIGAKNAARTTFANVRQLIRVSKSRFISF
jgi:hypothetical protein